MKHKLLLIISLGLFLFSCGGGSDSVTQAVTTTSITSISNSTGASGTYTLSASGLEGKEVYALITNDNLSSSSNLTVSISGISSMTSSTKSSTVSKDEMLPRIDIDGKFTKNLPTPIKGANLSTSKSSTVSKSYTIGTSYKTFAVTLTNNSNSSSSDTETTVTATLRAQNVGTRTVNIWVDNSATLNNTYITNILNNFSVNTNNIYSTLTNIYGAEWASHSYSNLIPYTGEIDILITPLNQYYNSSASGFVMGYFAPMDTFTQTYLNSTYPSAGYVSNESNMFYMDSNLFFKTTSLTAEENTYYHDEIYSTLAHEFTHMLMWYQKYVLRNASADTWLDETMAMISEDLMDDNITLESGTLEGSKSRIDGFNTTYNNIPVIDKDNSYDLENYASDGVFGLYLTRAYGTSSLAFLKNIMQSTYTSYDAIENATGESFSTILQYYAKALMLSSDSSVIGTKITMNKTFSTSYGTYTYNFEPVNIFNTSYYNTFNYLSSAVEGSGTSFRKLKGSTGATGNWTFTIPNNNMPFQIIVKNADGTFDSTTSATLNSAIVKN